VSESPPRYVRLVALGALLLALIVGGRSVAGELPRFSSWVSGQGILGALVFLVGYAVATVALIPGSLLTLSAGAVFGLARGIPLVFLGALLGSSGAFLIARYLARAAVEKRLQRDPRFTAVDEAVGRGGRRIVFLLRLSPLVPFGLLNYALGLTRVRFSDYLMASVGMLPGTALYVYYGKLAGDLAGLAGGGAVRRDAGYWIVLALGLAATIAVTIVVTRLARRTLAGGAGAGA